MMIYSEYFRAWLLAVIFGAILMGGGASDRGAYQRYQCEQLQEVHPGVSCDTEGEGANGES